jgi:hypothetical protein
MIELSGFLKTVGKVACRNHFVLDANGGLQARSRGDYRSIDQQVANNLVLFSTSIITS